MERRDFLKNCLMGCAAGAITSIALQSCKSIHYAASSLDNNKLRIKKSEFKDEEGHNRALVVVRHEKLEFPIAVYTSTENSTSVYTALCTKCTHSGCEVQPNKISLVCPCHGSEFSNKGKVLNPPAERDLKLYIVTTDNENIFIQL